MPSARGAVSLAGGGYPGSFGRTEVGPEPADTPGESGTEGAEGGTEDVAVCPERGAEVGLATADAPEEAVADPVTFLTGIGGLGVLTPVGPFGLAAGGTGTP